MVNELSSPMDLAMAEAEAAAGRGEVPVGAVVVDGRSGRVLAQAGNAVEAAHDPTAHAEMLAIRAAAAARGTARLVDCDIYVTLEPCAMCAQAIALARLRRLYFGAADPKGAGSSTARASSGSRPATTGPRSSAASRNAAPPRCCAASSRRAARVSPACRWRCRPQAESL